MLRGDEVWAESERDVESSFDDVKVDILHAPDLHRGHGAFKGWKVLKKQTFSPSILGGPMKVSRRREMKAEITSELIRSTG
jgi:hypothetical protein